jgi:antitoxin ParD1/3/4
MNVSLTRELEQLVSEKVKTGMYQTASEVVRDGLRLLKERDEQLESRRREVRSGSEAVAREEFTDYGGSDIIRNLSDRAKARGIKGLAEKN